MPGPLNLWPGPESDDECYIVDNLNEDVGIATAPNTFLLDDSEMPSDILNRSLTSRDLITLDDSQDPILLDDSIEPITLDDSLEVPISATDLRRQSLASSRFDLENQFCPLRHLPDPEYVDIDTIIDILNRSWEDYQNERLTEEEQNILAELEYEFPEYAPEVIVDDTYELPKHRAIKSKRFREGVTFHGRRDALGHERGGVTHSIMPRLNYVIPTLSPLVEDPEMEVLGEEERPVVIPKTKSRVYRPKTIFPSGLYNAGIEGDVLEPILVDRYEAEEINTNIIPDESELFVRRKLPKMLEYPVVTQQIPEEVPYPYSNQYCRLLNSEQDEGWGLPYEPPELFTPQYAYQEDMMEEFDDYDPVYPYVTPRTQARKDRIMEEPYVDTTPLQDEYGNKLMRVNFLLCDVCGEALIEDEGNQICRRARRIWKIPSDYYDIADPQYSQRGNRYTDYIDLNAIRSSARPESFKYVTPRTAAREHNMLANYLREYYGLQSSESAPLIDIDAVLRMPPPGRRDVITTKPYMGHTGIIKYPEHSCCHRMHAETEGYISPERLMRTRRQEIGRRPSERHGTTHGAMASRTRGRTEPARQISTRHEMGTSQIGRGTSAGKIRTAPAAMASRTRGRTTPARHTSTRREMGASNIGDRTTTRRGITSRSSGIQAKKPWR